MHVIFAMDYRVSFRNEIKGDNSGKSYNLLVNFLVKITTFAPFYPFIIQGEGASQEIKLI
jgi:hypothetical protein